jgi:hypothetical protein
MHSPLYPQFRTSLIPFLRPFLPLCFQRYNAKTEKVCFIVLNSLFSLACLQLSSGYFSKQQNKKLCYFPHNLREWVVQVNGSNP